MTRTINGSVAGAFSETEEAFFRAGDEGRFSTESDDESFVERRAPTDRPVSAREDDEEEWDWQIAIVRARGAGDH